MKSITNATNKELQERLNAVSGSSSEDMKNVAVAVTRELDNREVPVIIQSGVTTSRGTGSLVNNG